ncbi:hypothetical protein [Buttiauxella sp. A111]|uniref:hypothetical protein n=1 Tax=Buttiauxella sp. A111 TaxID=2563088 RepID=UPI0010D86B08|nr:hypothetical protein [Buttiauxella sp. A111]GDX04434.1 hypothetical protein BSPA111_06000 [Buttiauxella sp. A111]
MASGEQESKTAQEIKSTEVKGKHAPEVYFHPGSATLLCVDASGSKVLEQEHDLMASLLEKLKQAQKTLDDVNFEALSQAGRQPERKGQDKIQKAYDDLNKANKALRNELMSLTKNPPEGELLDDKMKDTAIGIMELIPLKKNSVTGFKSTYVRSDKISSHWRRYQLSEVDKKSGEASFIKYENKSITTQDAEGNNVTRTVRKAKIDTQVLKEQLKETEKKVKLELIEDSNVILTNWATEMNKSLSWPKDGGKGDESVYDQYVDIGAQAQLMRYSQGAGLEGEFNPLKGKVKGKIEGHASFALGEAKAEASLYLPDRLGISLLFPGKVTPETPDGICNMGALRFAIKTVLSGSVGASLGIELGVEMDWSGEMGKGYGIRGRSTTLPPPPPPGQRRVNLVNPKIPEAQAGGEIGAFVGIQAGGNISGAIEWFDPHPDDTSSIEAKNIKHDDKSAIVPKEKKFAEIAKLEMGVTVQAGAGGSGVFYVTYIQGRFRIYCKAAFCWGVGAKGSVGFEVDGGTFAAFMKSFMYMLRNVDYQKLEQMMEGDSFKTLCTIPLIMAAQGIEAAAVMIGEVDDIIGRLKLDLKNENKRVALMNSIRDNPNQLKYSPPETKGAIIAQLMDISWVDSIDPRNQNLNPFTFNYWKRGPIKLRKQAIFKALKWVQSKADYDNVMQHLSKTPGERKGDKTINEKILIDFLSYGEVKYLTSTNYGEKLAWLYESLPNQVDPDAPFVPISEQLMDEYLAMIDSQHSNDVMDDDKTIMA